MIDKENVEELTNYIDKAIDNKLNDEKFFYNILDMAKKMSDEKLNDENFYAKNNEYTSKMNHIEKWIVKFWLANIRNFGISLRHANIPVEDFDRIALMSTFLTYKTGYCYHFSKMLESVFGNGQVCWAAPYYHFCYVEDGEAYDITGVYKSGAYYMIPENYMGLTIFDFLQDDKRNFDPSAEELIAIVKNYCRMNNVMYDESIEDILKEIDIRHSMNRITR